MLRIHALFVLALTVWALMLSASPSTANADDLLDQLKSLPHVAAVTESSSGGKVRFFEIQFEQPVDHFDPTSSSFRQKLALIHRGTERPMVLQTSGYMIFDIYPAGITSRFATNQLQVEHRYFDRSAPANLDWTKLTVRQSAEDFHRITESFKNLYNQRWVNTGASKGGMTSIFHRRFYPNDLDGTVADVAPLSYTTDDPRYEAFLDQVGGDALADCRADLSRFRVDVLKRKTELLPFIEGEFAMLGSNEAALEHSMIEMPFTFWQYGTPANCALLPKADAQLDAEQLYSKVKEFADPAGMVDTALVPFQPYFYQAALELGAPGARLDSLQGLLSHPYTLEQYLPGGKSVPYSDATMKDVESWVATQAEGMMFVYGEFDPWTAGAYRNINLGPNSDNHFLVQPKGNHSATVTRLPKNEQVRALDVIARWLGNPAIPDGHPGVISVNQPTLEDIEFRARRKLKF